MVNNLKSKYIVNHSTKGRKLKVSISNTDDNIIIKDDETVMWRKNVPCKDHDIAFFSIYSIIKFNIIRNAAKYIKKTGDFIYYSVIFHRENTFTCVLKCGTRVPHPMDAMKEYGIGPDNVEVRQICRFAKNHAALDELVDKPFKIQYGQVSFDSLSLTPIKPESVKKNGKNS